MWAGIKLQSSAASIIIISFKETVYRFFLTIYIIRFSLLNRDKIKKNKNKIHHTIKS